MNQAFADHPEKVIVRQSGARELPLDNSDQDIASLHLTIQPPVHPPSYLLTGNYLDINYTNGDRVVYEYTSDSQVIKWTILREQEGAIPTVPPLPNENLPTEEQIGALKEMTLRVKERTRHIRESIANLKLAQKMGTNGQPASAPDTRRAITIVRRGSA